MAEQKLTLGSLFDGSGTFSLGAWMTNIEPKWCSMYSWESPISLGCEVYSLYFHIPVDYSSSLREYVHAQARTGGNAHHHSA